MSLQKVLGGEIPVEIFHRWMAPEAIRENRFTEKSDVVCSLNSLSLSVCVCVCVCVSITAACGLLLMSVTLG